jgi:serine protease AprX
MSTTTVFVRLVPKNRQAISRMDASIAPLAPNAARAFSPDPKQAERAQVQLAGLNVSVQKTPENRLEAAMSPEQFTNTFGVEVKDTPTPSITGEQRITRRRLTEHEYFLQPVGEIVVPDKLKDTIEFAYVPRPVEYYDVSFVPPIEGAYHLRLETVAQAVNAIRCHRRGWTGRGVKIAMVDSGFARHPYFERGGYNIVRLSGPGSDKPEKDESGHGTGESANILAVAPDVALICIKQGSGAVGDLEMALAQKPDIMTNSWGWSIDNMSKPQLKQTDPNMFNELLDIETIIADAVSRGVIVCFAGGNGHFSFPASFPQVLAIGGVMVIEDGGIQASDYASSFTSQLYPNRRIPDFCGVVGSATAGAHGVLPGHIMLPVPPNSYLDGENFFPQRVGLGWGIFSGTSAASPQVAAVIALMKSANPKLTLEQARQMLTSTAADVIIGQSAMGEGAGQGLDLATGAGLVDAFRACEAAAALI